MYFTISVYTYIFITYHSAQTDLRIGRLGAQITAAAMIFSLHHRVKTGSENHPTSYQIGNGCSFPGGKAAEAWSWWLTSI
jgi:hypothetical protein